MTSNPIKNWAEEEKPREKFLLKGAKILTNVELIAILINHGTPSKSAIDLARELLQSCNNSLPELGNRSVQHLSSIKGIGKVKAIRILAALELGLRRDSDFHHQKKISLDSSFKIYSFLRNEIIDLKQEIFGVIYLDNNLSVKTHKTIFMGGITKSIVDIRLILKYAFEYDAVAIVIYHNHPSGKLQASVEDKNLTMNVKNACETCNIKLLDHLILTNINYYSFADNNFNLN